MTTVLTVGSSNTKLDEQFLGFGSDEEVKVRSPTRSPTVKSSPRKPRRRPRSSPDRSSAAHSDSSSVCSPLSKSETMSMEKIKKKEIKSGEKKRGRPPALSSVKFKLSQVKDISDIHKGSKEAKENLKKIKRAPSTTFQHAAKIKKLRTGKLSPLKSKFKTGGKLQIGRKALEKPQRVRKEKDGTPPLTKEEKTAVRQSPRRIKPVRIIPSTKRTDATIAKQLLQRAKKGAQKKIEKEAAKLQGRKGRTQLKNIRQFIMPVVSAISSRIIKTPKRFIEDEDYDPPIKIARLESTPNSRFSATSCGSSEKSSAASQHSSQMSSDSSRSSSPSVDTSTDSQASEEMQALSEERSNTPEAHTPLPISQSPENDNGDRRSRRFSMSERSFGQRAAKKLSTLQSVSQQQSSSSPPPPLLTPPPPLQPATGISDHTPWLMPPTIPLASPFLPTSAAPMQEKRKSILREPTFRWTSLKHSRSEPQYFSSAKYAKEGLIRKPVFDNFRPPPLTPEDVGFASGFSTSGATAPARLFSALHSGTRFDMHKRSPLLRAPRFTPSEAHSRIFESVTLPSSVSRTTAGISVTGISSRKRKRRVFSPIRSEPRSPSHSMRTRSGRLSTSDLTTLTPQSSVSSSLTNMSVSSLATSALNSTFTFSSHPLTQSGESAERSQRPRKQISTPAEPFSSTNPTPGRVSKEKVVNEDVAAASSVKKAAGRKKSSAIDPVADASAVALVDMTAGKTKMPKKGRGGLEKSDLNLSPTVPPLEKDKALCLSAPSSSTVKHSTSSISSMLAQADKLPMTDKRVASLLKKAKAQLYKIEKSKSLKQADQPKAQGQESDSSETSVRGPRIKHVCRRAAVALGRKRAVFPDDMPTLSALPWEEREKILSSMGNDDKSSIAGSEEAEPLAPPIKPIKPVTRNKAPQEPPVKKGRRSRRCGQCPGCQVPEDCGVCTNCLDKPKFGGRNIKKQCCKMRKCQNLQWMPSKAYLQKQAKVVKKKEKKSKTNEKKESHSGKNQVDSGQKPAPQTVLAKEDNALKKSSEPARKPSEEKNEEGNTSVPVLESKQVTASGARKTGKQAPQPLQVPLCQPPSSGPLKKEVPKTTPSEPKKKQTPQPELGIEQSKQKKVTPRPSFPVKQKPKEKEKPPPVNKPENSTLNLLSTLSNGSSSKQKAPTDGVHRIRVDFKFVYCQVCCEPFHKFCLEESERPLEDQLENWCCRRCKFCHVCGRQHQATKQLLECNKCRNSYHPECLGPNYPTKPTKKKKVWICTKCVRCKSCGSTTPGKGWDAQWSHDFSLCHDCAKLFAKGNFCPLCDKCYDDDDYESKMMQCGKCDRWVHSKCENLSDEMYEILSNLPESVAYTCINCTEQHPAEWRLALEKELQVSLKQVLTALLNSRTTSHLLRYRQAAKPPDLNPETEESIPSRSSPEGPDPPVLTEVSKQEEQQPLDLEGVKRKMDQGGYTSVLEFSDDIVKIIQAAINSDGGQPEVKKANSMVKSFFIRQMERVFPWFSVKKSRFWEPNKVTSNSGMLPNAVLPPSLDHNYAQWQEREENNHTEQPPLMKKIIPAPKPKGPGEPDSPTPLHPPTPPISSKKPDPWTGSDRSREDSPELNPPPDVEDNRQCALCLKYGDDSANDAGRLLYIGQNEWTHVNCALWSAEVFEDDDGSLKNVHMAVIRGKQLRCEFCQKSGATVGCCLTSCTSNYHFMCSRAKNCVFLDDKKVYCQRHRDLIRGEVVPENGFEVLRRVFVDFEGISLRRKFLSGLEPENIHMMIGSMTIDCLGILNDLSDCEDKLFPIGYQCSRVYWSTTDARKRCVYTCKIMECRPPVIEPDINSTVEHDENRTIAHSPAPMESESQSKNAQKESDAESQSKGAEPTALTELSSTSGSQGDVQGSPSDTPTQESQNNSYPNLPVEDRNLMLQDGTKAQEDGSYKRRYPRRSARARSNMFFGLTPLYGVRSYGEEDIPFYSNSTGKKRGKRSAEGQVDGADDLSTSDEDDLYYYNFTRTVVSSSAEERLGSHNLFKEEEQCNLPKISQLDGVDDGTESDTSVTATTRKVNQVTKRSGKENGTENLKLDRAEEAGEKVQVTKSSTGHKADPKIDNCHAVSRVKTQGQDSLEAQLSSLDTGRRGHASTPSDKNLLDTFNTELLKSDSDNNNSDDCGNILPSDIMDFVLKNTPSMQALGESPESSSSELLTLGEGLGLDSNRGKDMGLFEVFSPQLPTAEPVDSSVSSSISAEEQFELPLELPSDLSVLTTRSPTVPSQNRNRLAVISESALSSSGERSILALPSTESGEKRVTVTEKSASGEGDATLLSPGVDPSPEGHMTPDHFIQGHIDAEHIASPPCAPVEQGHGSNQDLTRNSGTPGLQVPVSPTVPLQNQKYVPNSTDSPGPSQISNAAVQTTPPHLKPAAEKLLVVNQNMQPLYVLQTLPNGVTQKIQLTPSGSSTQSVMETNTSVLGPMGSALTLTTELNPSLPSSQSLFPPTSKGLLPMSHHQHLHTFPTATQSGFPPNIGSPASGLLIGVQPPPDPQLLVSEASQRTDLGTTVTTPTSGLGKKRPISRLQSRKNKKLAPSGTPSAIAPSEMVSNMTLINFAPSQLSNSPLDLGTLGNSTPHRTVPNIIKRSKSGVMYFEQASLLPQGVGAAPAAAVGTSSSIIGPDAGHLTTGPVPGLASNSSVLNVVSMQATAAPSTGGSVPGHVLGQGSVTLTSPGLLGDLGSISNLLIKASQQSLGLQEQHMTLPPGSGMFSQLGTSQTPATAAMTAASSICVLPSAQTMGMTVAQSSTDPEGPYQLQHMTQLLAIKNASSQLDLATASAPQLSSFPQLVDIPNNTGLEQSKVSSTVMHASSASPGGSPSSGQQSASSSVLGPTKMKPKIKRIQPPLDKGNGKKHKTPHMWTSPPEVHIPDRGANAVSQVSTAGQMAILTEPQSVQNTANEQENTGSKASEEEEGTFSSPLMFWLQQEQKRKESLGEKKPKKGLVFEISSDDGFQICAESIEDAWKSLTDKVQEARSNARLKQLSFAGVNGLRMLGIIHDAVVFLIEQLYGAKHCHNYKFRFHKPEETNEPPLNPHGSARAEVHLRKSAFDMFNFLASKHRQPPEYNPNDEEEEEVQLKSARRATSMDLPMPMRFRHLKKTSKEAVGVYRSPIHGRGLFCKRNIDAGEMVIEYSGNVIRSILTDKREKYYDSKGIGCYMFRIDDSEVVDATMHGNAARFINHSCEPNCYSRVINIDGQKHIVIFAMRKIYRGEELTYDYKFPIEDASNKLPCNCGAKKCRKFLN
ncbi:Histone-lysine N-methyltransferase MLL [Chelonia mydas]|uniref:Histone-lysine N-methyltransferase n=1 Tax=Chelonia mydas TaxID=8469 RepID=M7BN08_CHEMY|nr:Histone-lysine N-methyltransferase MLL [Chelonia mydas]